jgi:hypothetical protein
MVLCLGIKAVLTFGGIFLEGRSDVREREIGLYPGERECLTTICTPPMVTPGHPNVKQESQPKMYYKT